MKNFIALSLFLSVTTYLGAQTLDTVRIITKARKFTPREHILIMFELMDTVDATGNKSVMSRSFYFDERNRKISSVRELYNPKKPEKGTQVIYTFGGNKLSAVTVIPSKSTCKNCTSQYYYTDNLLTSKQENRYTTTNPQFFATQALQFQSRLPQDLPWGYFSDEIMVNGERKKVKKKY